MSRSAAGPTAAVHTHQACVWMTARCLRPGTIRSTPTAAADAIRRADPDAKVGMPLNRAHLQTRQQTTPPICGGPRGNLCAGGRRLDLYLYPGT